MADLTQLQSAIEQLHEQLNIRTDRLSREVAALHKLLAKAREDLADEDFRICRMVDELRERLL